MADRVKLMQLSQVNFSFSSDFLVMKPIRRPPACSTGNAIGQTMIKHYRGHRIVVRNDAAVTAEIAELKSMQTLPTMATATQAEGPDVCLARAIELVDLYCTPVANDR